MSSVETSDNSSSVRSSNASKTTSLPTDSLPLPKYTGHHNNQQESLDYTTTVMYGSHLPKNVEKSDALRKSRRFQSMRKNDKNIRSAASMDNSKSQQKSPNVCQQWMSCATCPRMRDAFTVIGQKLSVGFGEEWFFLVLLGVIMASLSFLMDYAILKFQEAHIIVYYEVKG